MQERTIVSLQKITEILDFWEKNGGYFKVACKDHDMLDHHAFYHMKQKGNEALMERYEAIRDARYAVIEEEIIMRADVADQKDQKGHGWKARLNLLQQHNIRQMAKEAGKKGLQPPVININFGNSDDDDGTNQG